MSKSKAKPLLGKIKEAIDAVYEMTVTPGGYHGHFRDYPTTFWRVVAVLVQRNIVSREREPVKPGWSEDSEEEGARLYDRVERFGRDGCFADPGLLPENRWRDFPTVSPVHAGNDGLPFDISRLTIPFAKWRTESLKACGNAIVTGVMYRLFQGIEEVYNQWKNGEK